jgi:subtilisin family serine protease
MGRWSRGWVAGLLVVTAGCGEDIVANVPTQEDKIDPPLLAALDGPEPIPVAILLRTQLLLGPDALGDFIAREAGRDRRALRAEVISDLKAIADDEQSAVLSALGSPDGARSLWIANALFVSLTSDQIRTISGHDDVRHLYLMTRAPASYETPGPVGSVLPARAPRPFDPAGKQVPWNLEELGAARVWTELGVTGEGSVVALIDNGTNYTHPDLTANIWTNPDEIANNGLDDDGNGLVDDYYGFDFRSGRAEVALDPSRGNGAGHGTYTAGIVAGDGSGGTITGVAPRAQLMLEIIGGDTHAMGRAFEYALEKGADVATMSFSIPGLGNVRGLWRLMTDHAFAAGLVSVSGAGNFQQSAPAGVQQRIPEGIPSVISVGGVDASRQLVPFSSLGPVSWSTVRFYEDHPSLTKPDVAAFPGPEYPILQAEGPGYHDPNTRRGNSFSGPHAAGVAALILAANPALPAWEVKAIIEDTARDLPPVGPDNETGHGLLDAYAAVRAALERNPGG